MHWQFLTNLLQRHTVAARQVLNSLGLWGSSTGHLFVSIWDMKWFDKHWTGDNCRNCAVIVEYWQNCHVCELFKSSCWQVIKDQTAEQNKIPQNQLDSFKDYPIQCVKLYLLYCYYRYRKKINIVFFIFVPRKILCFATLVGNWSWDQKHSEVNRLPRVNYNL